MREPSRLSWCWRLRAWEPRSREPATEERGSSYRGGRGRGHRPSIHPTRPTPQGLRVPAPPVRHVPRPSVRVFGNRFQIIFCSIFREGHEITFGRRPWWVCKADDFIESSPNLHQRSILALGPLTWPSRVEGPSTGAHYVQQSRMKEPRTSQRRRSWRTVVVRFRWLPRQLH